MILKPKDFFKRVPPESFCSIGGCFTNHKQALSEKVANRRFRAHFGISPSVCSILWNLLQSSILKMPKTVVAEHLLWALSLLKTYDSTVVLASCAGGVDEKTFDVWAWRFIEAIAGLKVHVIKWEKRLKGDVGNQCLVSVDGTDFCIPEQTPFSKEWYSHKFNGPGLWYEVAVSIKGGDIVWVNGPFKPGKWNDISIFKEGLVKKLSCGEKVEADKGYQSHEKCITPCNYRNELQVKKAAMIRSRQEGVNRKLKVFEALKQVF